MISVIAGWIVGWSAIGLADDDPRRLSQLFTADPPTPDNTATT
jgi:hypothetical protein